MPDLEPHMTGWNEVKWYDPINDRDSIKIIGYSGSGSYWVGQPLTPPGKSRRAQREHLLYLLEQAIKRDGRRIAEGKSPIEMGEVPYSEPELSDPIFDPNQF
jgi:hypothetical protein